MSLSQNHKQNQINLNSGYVQKPNKVIEYSKTEEFLKNMTQNSDLLKQGYKVFGNFETCKNFYVNLIKIIFESQSNDKIKKLAASTLKIFLNKNWSDETYISLDEKKAIVSVLLNHIHIDNYFLKNFISKLLGIIAAKEFPNCYNDFIKVILNNLAKENEPAKIDSYLRIVHSIMNESDDRIAVFSGEILPVIIKIFKESNLNQKNREKCLKIITHIFNKLSYADGTDPELIAKNLDTNDLMEQSLALFTSILVSHPKFLFDIKKYTVKILDILVRDMPLYSCKFYGQLIEPTWRLIVLELSLYTQSIVFSNEIEYEEEEVYKMEDENHLYSRGYESDEEEEKYGIEGLIVELVDFSIDLLKRRNVMEALRSVLLTFLLCIKGYCLMPHHSILLWKNDPNLFITEEYDDENINTVRSKCLDLIKEISKEIDEDSLLKFLKILLSEFTQGLNADNYSEVKKLDDYNFLEPYLEKMNSDDNYIYRRHEANLLIIGSLSEDLVILKEKNRLSKSDITELIQFLFMIISNPNKENSILVGRALWCISRLLNLVKTDSTMLAAIFEGVSISLCHSNSDLSVKLVACQCLTNICMKIKDTNYQNDKILLVYPQLITLLNEANEDTLIIPIECITALSKINKEKALFVPLNASKLIVEIYSKYYNHPLIGVKILELVKIWSGDNRSARVLIGLFVPFAIFVFEDFFKSLGKVDKTFEEIKRTVMTEHGGANLDVKANLDMLPVNMNYLILFNQNLIDIIAILTKYCHSEGDRNNLVWISLIVNIICEILLKTNDIQILQRGSSFLRFYILFCKEYVISQKQQPILTRVILKFFDLQLLESALTFVGNMVAQYYAHIDGKIDVTILEAIVKRIYRAKMPSIVQSLVVVFSRFLNLFPKEILKFLTSIQVENRVGLKVLIDKWLLHQPLFRGSYYINVSIKALTILFELKDSVVETLMVIGYDPSHSTASIEVNAPFKILSVLIRCYNNELLQEKVKKERNDYNNLIYNNDYLQNDDENERLEAEVDEFQDEDEMKDDFIDEDKKLDINTEEFKYIEEEPRDFNSKLNFAISQGNTGGLNNLEIGSEKYLSEMLGFDYNDAELEDEDNSDEDLLYLKDIDYNFVLKDFLYNWFKSFKQRDAEYLAECLKCLPKSDQETFKQFNI